MMITGEFSVTRILKLLEDDNLLPGILFRTSRRQCDTDVEILGERSRFFLPEDAQQRIRSAVDSFLQRFSFEPEIVHAHPHFQVLVECGVGSHHAGQLLVWRLLLEELMSAGLLRLLIATGTVAAGVDFPARTVVITAHSKRGSEGFNVLTASELQQMSGRAGRRGKDTVGFCLVAPSKFSDARVVNEIRKRPPEPLKSAYFAAPSTVLNLLKFRTVEDLRFTVQRSLGAFLDRRSAQGVRHDAENMLHLDEHRPKRTKDDERRSEKRYRRRLREAEEMEERQQRNLESTLRSLETLGYLVEGKLSPKGFWAAELCTSVVLHLAEAVEAGLFQDLPVEGLMGAVAALSGDPYRSYLNIRKNPIPQELLGSLEEIADRIAQVYISPLTQEFKVVPDAAITVITWADSETWPEFAGLLRLGKVAEGDAARLITQTADNLNQLSRLASTHPDLAAAAEEGRRRILRPPLLEGGLQI